MGQLRGQLGWWALIVMVMALGSCGVAGLVKWQRDPSTQLTAAQARWSARPFSHYRLMVETSPTCQSDVEVRDEKVVGLYRKPPCGASDQTIDSIFALLKRNRPIVQDCTFYKCACSQTITVYAIYDGQWGYPRRIAVWLRREFNWTKRDLWQYIWSFQHLPDCQRTSDTDIFSVISLEPLP